jgi:hypothetical protein
MPPTALANGLWVGEVPKELSDLTFVERLLISRVRSNHCIVHVLKGGWKMRANAIMFPTPIPKVCNMLNNFTARTKESQLRHEVRSIL